MTSALQWQKKLKLKLAPDAELIALLEAASDDAPNQAPQQNAQPLEVGFSSKDVFCSFKRVKICLDDFID